MSDSLQDDSFEPWRRWAVPMVIGGAVLSVAAAVLSVTAALWVLKTEPPATEAGCACADPTPSPAATEPTTEPGESKSTSRPEPGPVADSEGPPHLGQSVGSPREGELFEGRRLDDGDGYFVRDPRTAWATQNTIEHLRTAVAKVRSKFPRIHELAIGDISTQTGGPLAGHLSHQSGRDVDLGLYYRQRPEGYRKRFVKATRQNLHFRATFALLEALAASAKQPTGVDWIILDYRLQRMLYNWARTHGIDEGRLSALFQYPRGPTVKHGIIRHFPGHKDHIHVRFKCPAGDEHCTSPTIPPVGLESL